MNRDISSKTISITTPSFNQGDFIGKTIESVLSQEGDFYIDYVVKDAISEDDSVETIKAIEKKLDQNCDYEIIDGIKFYKRKNKEFGLCRCNGVSFRWVSVEDKGHGDGINQGFKDTFGDIMAWINSDDLYHEGAFQKVLNTFSTYNQIKWVMGRNTWWDRDGNEIIDYLMLKNKWDFLRGNYGWIQQESTFWTRELWDEVGGKINIGYKFMVDNELWARFFLKTDLYIINEKLGGYRVWGENRAKINIEKIDLEIQRIVSEANKKLRMIDKINLNFLKVNIIIARALPRFITSTFLNVIAKLFPYKVVDLINDGVDRVSYDIYERNNKEIAELYKRIDGYL